MRWDSRGVRALAVSASLAIGCAGRAPAPRAAALPSTETPVPARAVSRLEDVEPDLLALEDRRAFDAPRLEPAAASANARVRARTALALGRIGDERAAPLLARLTADSSAEVRESAAFAVGILGEPALSSALVPLLRDADPAVAARAAWAVAFLEQPAGEEALIAAIPGAAPGLRAAFLRPLWRFSTPAAAAAALPFVADPDPRTRGAALYVLARRPQEASLPALTAGLADSDPDTAAICARALGVLGKPESIAPLSRAVEGSRSLVATHAMLALAAILEKNTAAVLPADTAARLSTLSGDTNPNVAVPALALLRWLASDREVFRRLWTVASSGRERRQQVALISLMAGLAEKARDLVDASMASPDPFLRGAVAESLSFLPAADAATRREKLAADPEVFVRQKVLEGLKTRESVLANRALVDAALSDPDAGVRAASIDALALLEDAATLPPIQEAVVRSYEEPAPDVPIEAITAAEARAPDPAAQAVVKAAYRHPSVVVSRLARRSLVRRFHADPAAFPWKTYAPSTADDSYARVLAAAREARTARVDTERGSFTICLATDEAPLTVENFVQLARRGFFDGARIHRVAPGFVVQDGDPTGTGNGGPGYEIRDELNTIPYDTGTVGMALAGPDTGGSQWFVTQAPQPHLDGGYTVFGRVVAGMDVVNRIEQGDRILRVVISPAGPR